MKPVLIFAGLAAAAVLFYSRQAKAAPASAAAAGAARVRRNNPGRIDRTQTYANPQTMGELFARSVVAVTNGFIPNAPKVATSNQQTPGFYGGWQGGTATAVQPGISAHDQADPYWSDGADAIPGGPVYDVGKQSNPWAWAQGDTQDAAAAADNWMTGWAR